MSIAIEAGRNYYELLPTLCDLPEDQGKTKVSEVCAEEIRSAEELWIKSIQNQCFPNEICHLVTARKLPEQHRTRQVH